MQSRTLVSVANNLVTHFTLENTKSLFDKRTTGLLLSFYFLSGLNMYVKTSSKLIIDQYQTQNQSRLPLDEDQSIGEMFYGERKVTKEITGELLKIFIKTSISIKSQVDYSNKDIEKIVFRLSQAEKNTYIERF